MLVLSRKPNETITLRRGDEKIVITVIQMRQVCVKLGIDAPKDWNIVRTELEDKRGETCTQ